MKVKDLPGDILDITLDLVTYNIEANNEQPIIYSRWNLYDCAGHDADIV